MACYRMRHIPSDIGKTRPHGPSRHIAIFGQFHPGIGGSRPFIRFEVRP
jgi:hypothetical protein